MRVPIYKRLMEARDNPNADLHKLTTDILALFSVVGQSEQLEAFGEWLLDNQRLDGSPISEYVSEYLKSL